MSGGAGSAWDAVVVGGGPSGAAAAYWLADRGRSVLLVERHRFPRDKACGDALTPRAVAELHDMGLEPALRGFHDVAGLRMTAHGRSIEHRWRHHPDRPDIGKVVRRTALDQLVAEAAVGRGATLRQATSAAEIRQGAGGPGTVVVKGADGEVDEIAYRYLVLADGAHSPLSQSLGLERDLRYPFGLALRGYYRSSRHDDPYIEIDIDMSTGTSNRAVPGYGWVFPVGDGTINVGVGILNTYRHWRTLKTNELLLRYLDSIRERWELSSLEPEGRLLGGRIPMGGSIAPIVGRDFVVGGDASGLNNPFIGEGIGFAYETGRATAAAVDAALASGRDEDLRTYAGEMDRRYGRYFRLGNTFARLIGNPTRMRILSSLGMRWPASMNIILPIMDHTLFRRAGPPELAYSAVAAVARRLPERVVFGKADGRRSGGDGLSSSEPTSTAPAEPVR